MKDELRHLGAALGSSCGLLKKLSFSGSALEIWNKSTTMTKETFTGSSDYIASEQLKEIVNIARSLQRPLLIRGEPGTGDSFGAFCRSSLGLELFTWHVKSLSKAQEGLYHYDAVQRLPRLALVKGM